jgi:cysteine desulfurase/selenocysteine lyase
MDHYGIPGTARASYSIYNTHEDVDALFAGIRKAKSLFG